MRKKEDIMKDAELIEFHGIQESRNNIPLKCYPLILETLLDIRNTLVDLNKSYQSSNGM